MYNQLIEMSSDGENKCLYNERIEHIIEVDRKIQASKKIGRLRNYSGT